MYLCEICMQKHKLNLRFMNGKLVTMCESCHKIKPCYKTDIKFIKLDFN